VSGVTRREALAGTAGAAAALSAPTDAAVAARRKRKRRPDLGSGGSPMQLAAVAALARQAGRGEPVAIVDLAAVDRNCEVLLKWSREHAIAWRPAYKTLQAPELMAYVLRKLDRPRVMIHHLRNLSQLLPLVPSGTDFLMGYPPTLGELERWLTTRRAKGEKRYTLRINVDSIALLSALVELSRRAAKPLPIEIVLEIEDFRGGIVPGAELSAALALLRGARERIRLGALLCYDTLAIAESSDLNRRIWARYAQDQLNKAVAQIAEQAGDFVDVGRLIRNGPGSANYRNWGTSDAANEFSAGSAVLYANYLDGGFDTEGLHKALYLCAPVLRVQAHTVLGLPMPLPVPPSGLQFVLIKAGGWPTGNNPTLSKLVYPPGLSESTIGPVGYGRGANSSGMVFAPAGALKLGDYVVETAQQVMEGQNYFGALHAAREGRVRALWPTLTRWSGTRAELP